MMKKFLKNLAANIELLILPVRMTLGNPDAYEAPKDPSLGDDETFKDLEKRGTNDSIVCALKIAYSDKWHIENGSRTGVEGMTFDNYGTRGAILNLRTNEITRYNYTEDNAWNSPRTSSTTFYTSMIDALNKVGTSYNKLSDEDKTLFDQINAFADSKKDIAQLVEDKKGALLNELRGVEEMCGNPYNHSDYWLDGIYQGNNDGFNFITGLPSAKTREVVAKYFADRKKSLGPGGAA